MDRTYENIPQQGQHQGAGVREDLSTSVRAEPAAYPPEHDRGAPPTAFELYHHEAEGVYRIRAGSAEAPHDTDPHYAHQGRYDHIDQLAAQLPEYARFLVFENPTTGEAFYDKQGNVTNWTPSDGFVQVSVFRDESAAAAYADRHNRKG